MMATFAFNELQAIAFRKDLHLSNFERDTGVFNSFMTVVPMDWFLYDKDIRHERVKDKICIVFPRWF